MRNCCLIPRGQMTIFPSQLALKKAQHRTGTLTCVLRAKKAGISGSANSPSHPWLVKEGKENGWIHLVSFLRFLLHHGVLIRYLHSHLFYMEEDEYRHWFLILFFTLPQTLAWKSKFTARVPHSQELVVTARNDRHHHKQAVSFNVIILHTLCV